MTNKLYLIRHGENLANITKEFSHRKVDYSLTAKGVLQAQQTALYFADRKLDEVWSSPLKRAVETAEIIAASKGLKLSVLENFREVDAGTLEDLPPTTENWRTYMKVVQDWFRGEIHSSFPGGENLISVRRRMREGLEKVLDGKDGKSIAIVGHGGIFSAGIYQLCPGLDPAAVQGHFMNCAISELDVTTEGGQIRGELISWGFCSHLTGEAAELVSPVPDDL